AGPGGGSAPALDLLVDRPHARLRALARREIVDPLAVELVADADPDRLETIENVELGERDAVDARGAHGLSNERGVEPAATALAARDDAELVALPAQKLARLVVELGR